MRILSTPLRLTILLALLSSCESLGDSVRSLTDVGIEFSGPDSPVYYGVKEIHPYKDAEKKSQDENAALQLVQYDELVGLPMRESAEVPAARSFWAENRSALYFKIDTSRLTGDLILTIERTRVVVIRKNNPVGYQIVRIY